MFGSRGWELCGGKLVCTNCCSVRLLGPYVSLFRAPVRGLCLWTNSAVLPSPQNNKHASLSERTWSNFNITLSRNLEKCGGGVGQ